MCEPPFPGYFVAVDTAEVAFHPGVYDIFYIIIAGWTYEELFIMGHNTSGDGLPGRFYRPQNVLLYKIYLTKQVLDNGILLMPGKINKPI